MGITAAIEQTRIGPWDETATFAFLSYSRAVQRAGGLALLLPPDDLAAREPGRWLDRIDALLLSGGNDIDPELYRQQPHRETSGVRVERDRFEIALANGALERGMPVLGICRGMEVLNLARGGDLVQHLPDEVGHNDHRHTPGAFTDHEVRLEPGSLAARVVGAERESVKSHHHQGIGNLGAGLKASGWAEDGIVEAIEIDQGEHPFALGVLWHPEEEERSRVVEALLDAARDTVRA